MSKRIDIYVDGSWLHSGHRKFNPKETGGWGAVIVESDEGREISPPLFGAGPAEPTLCSNNDTEIMAIHEGLRYLSAAKPYTSGTKITLHTDQGDFLNFMAGKSRGPSKERPAIVHTYIKQIQEMVRAMNVSLVFTSDREQPDVPPEDTGRMKLAHELAGREAWINRLEAQEGTIFRGGKLLRGTKALRSITSPLEREKEAYKGIGR